MIEIKPYVPSEDRVKLAEKCTELQGLLAENNALIVRRYCPKCYSSGSCIFLDELSYDYKCRKCEFVINFRDRMKYFIWLPTIKQHLGILRELGWRISVEPSGCNIDMYRLNLISSKEYYTGNYILSTSLNQALDIACEIALRHYKTGKWYKYKDGEFKEEL